MKKDNWLIVAIVGIVSIILLSVTVLYSKQIVNNKYFAAVVTPAEGMKKFDKPVMAVDLKKTYFVTLRTTVGDIAIELSVSKTPITVNNFIYLALKKYYDNTVFHRVVKDFMIQGGDPTGTGTGNPGYQFDDEKFDGTYTRGTVAMANSGPNTNGSQFFIVQKDSNLPKNYVIFGRVIEGMEVVDKIANAPVGKSTGGELSNPLDPV